MFVVSIQRDERTATEIGWFLGGRLATMLATVLGACCVRNKLWFHYQTGQRFGSEDRSGIDTTQLICDICDQVLVHRVGFQHGVGVHVVDDGPVGDDGWSHGPEDGGQRAHPAHRSSGDESDTDSGFLGSMECGKRTR